MWNIFKKKEEQITTLEDMKKQTIEYLTSQIEEYGNTVVSPIHIKNFDKYPSVIVEDNMLGTLYYKVYKNEEEKLKDDVIYQLKEKINELQEIVNKYVN